MIIVLTMRMAAYISTNLSDCFFVCHIKIQNYTIFNPLLVRNIYLWVLFDFFQIRYFVLLFIFLTSH